MLRRDLTLLPQACVNDDDCQVYTYYEDEGVCLLYESCDLLDTDPGCGCITTTPSACEGTGPCDEDYPCNGESEGTVRNVADQEECEEVFAH